MTDDVLRSRDFGTRSFVFEDIAIRSDGDGRTVEAYAAAFNVRTEIKDQDGHYLEELAPTSFNRTIANNGTNFGVFYNHARTLYGTPDGALSVPIGVPLEVRPDERGVFTVTRYLDNPLADSILDGIKQRAIRGQSFSGRFTKSTKAKAASRGDLPVITRTEVAMREYGPTVFPAYTQAMILGTRTVSAFLDELARMDPADLEAFRQMLGVTTPPIVDPVNTQGTPSGPAQVDDPATGHSARRFQFDQIRAKARKEGGPLS